MNPQTIGKIDRRLGKPICWALTLLRKTWGLTRFLGRRPAPPQVRKILFIKMIEQGATVLAYRALAEAVQRVGRENVYFWVFEENRPILDLLDVIAPQNIIVVRAKKLLPLVLDMIRTIWRVRGLKIDATVDMEFFSRASAILAFLSGAPVRIGLHRFTGEGPYRGDLLTHRIAYNPYLHAAAQYWLMVMAAWSDPRQRPMMKIQVPQFDGAPPPFVPHDNEKADLGQLLQRVAGEEIDRPIVLLNPNASDLLPLRKWPTERFVELGRQLLAEQDVFVFITGAPGERDAAKRVADAIAGGGGASPRGVDATTPARRCHNLAGRTTLRQLMVLYSIADVLVTNDSGPGHFSSMTDVKTIILFGPETPALYGPLGKHSNVIWQNLACSPCVNVFNHRFSPCNDNVCMQGITVEQVYEKVVTLLEKRRDAKREYRGAFSAALEANPDAPATPPSPADLEERVRKSFNSLESQS